MPGYLEKTLYPDGAGATFFTPLTGESKCSECMQDIYKK
jgi:hypothetical protein